jgi:hypothetical protein
MSGNPQRIKRLQEENKRLRQRIAELEQTVSELGTELSEERTLRQYAEQNAENRLYHELFRQLPMPIVVYQTDGLLVEINPSNEKLINTPRETLIGTFNMFEDQEALDKGHIEHFRRATKGEIVRMPLTSYDTTRAGLHNRRDDRVIWTESTYVPLYDTTNGTIRYVAELNQEVTNRVHAMQKQQQSEEHLRKIIQIMPVLVIAFDDAGNVIVWNDECERVTGYPAAQIVNNPHALDLLYPDKREREHMLAFWRQKKNDFRGWELEVCCKDGSKRTVAWSSISDRFSIPGWAVWGTGVDITDRRHVEKELRKSYDELESRVQKRTAQLTEMNTILQTEIAERKKVEDALRINEERYERAVKAANVGVWDWDLTTNSIYLAPNLKALLGFEDHEISDDINEWAAHVHPDDEEMVMQAATAHINGETPIYEVEHRMLHRDGSVRWFLVRGVVIRDSQGQPVRMSGTDSDITERKKMEDALRKREEHYRLISELISDYAYALHVDEDGTLTQEWVVSEAFTRTTGFTQQEVLQQGGPSSIMYPEDVSAIEEHRDELLKGHMHVCEFRIKTRDGLTRWLSDHGQPVWDEEQGRVVCIYGAIKDVTERRMAEEALRESEERYRSIITTMNEGVILHDKDGAIREWNTRAKNMLGRTTEKLLGQTSVDSNWRAIHEDGKPFAGINHPSLVALRTGRPCSNVVMGIYKPDGSLTWILVNAQPVFCDSTPAPCGAVTTFTDITQLKQAEEALTKAYTELEIATEELARSRDLLGTLFNGLPDGLVLLDRNGSILAVNQAIANILGYEPDRLLNRSWKNLCREVKPPFPVIELVEQTLQDGDIHRRRERYVGKDQRTARVLDIQTLPITGSQDTIDQVVVHIVDVTEQLTLEAIAIQHERLAASGALAATVAHEINTPLQSINHCLFLAYDTADPQRDSYLTMAREEIARISKIVRQLLDLHRPTSAQAAPFNVNPLVERVLTLTSSTLVKQQIHVKTELAPELPMLWGHADQITQVLMNLVLNAKKAMPDGGHLCVRTMVCDTASLAFQTRSRENSNGQGAAASSPESSGKAIVLQVEDTGMGMSPDVQERIFDSFFTTSPSGSGLGLTISQKIVVQHGGYISVQSVPGKGSTFSVVFPFSRIAQKRENNEDIS